MLELDDTLPKPMWIMGETFLLHGPACYLLTINGATVNPLLSFKVNISLGFKSTLERLCLSQYEEASDSLPYVVELALFLWLLPWFERLNLLLRCSVTVAVSGTGHLFTLM